MSTGRAIAINSLWMIGGRVVTTLLSLIVTAKLARALGVFGYGEYTTAFAYMNFFGVIADFGFYQILVREIAARPQDEKSITNNLFTLRTSFAIVIYGAAALLANVFPYSGTVKLGILVLALASLFQSVNTTFIGTFQVHHQMYKAVIGDVVGRIALVLLVLSALSHHVSLPTILSMYLITNLINLAITTGFVHKLTPVRLAYDWHQWRLLFIEAWPLGVVTALGILYFKIDTVILSILKSPTDVGIYGAAYKVFEILTVIPGIFMGNVFPALTRRLVHERDRVQPLIQAAFDALTFLGLGMAVGLSVLSGSIIRVLAGQSFVMASTVTVFGHPITAAIVLMILAVALIGVFIGNLWGFVVIALGKQRRMIIFGLWAVVLNVGLNLLLIPRFGYAAAAATTVITECFIAFVWGRLAHELLPARLEWTRTVKAIVAAAIMGLVIWPIRDGFIVTPVVVGSIAYIAALWILGALPENWRGYLKMGRTAA